MPEVNKDALYSSIFRMVGLAYTYNTSQLARLYGVSEWQFEEWLREMSFPEQQILDLRYRGEFPKTKCKLCGMVLPPTPVNNVFCGKTCLNKWRENRLKLATIIQSGRIPLIQPVTMYFDINSKEIIYD